MATLESEIWTQISLGNEKSYAEAYRFYYRRFYNYGRKFTNDIHLLEDVVQESLWTIWNKRNEIQNLSYPASYFYNTFRYQLFNKLKQNQNRQAAILVDDEPEFSVEQMIIEKEKNAVLQEKLNLAIRNLTSKQREAIFLRFYEGLSYDEVAAILNITTKATYKIMARALESLKESMLVSLGTILFLLRGM